MNKRIYVAGALSGRELDYLENVRKMCRVGYKLMRSGKYSPFVPALDFQLALMKNDSDEPFSVKEFYDYSMAWLTVSDAILVLPNYENSKGTLAEIEMATALQIPVFYSLEDMENYFMMKGR